MALSVHDARIGLHADKTRLVLDLSEKTDFRVFVLQNPWRMVVDMPDFDWRVGNISKPVKSGITGVRQGKLQPGISRVVIDLKGPVLIRSVFVLPHQKDKSDRLVIDFRTASRGQFLEQQKGQVFGKLKVIEPAQMNTTLMSMPVPASPQAASKPLTKQVSAAGHMALPQHKPSSAKWEKPLIVIDPGHGGVDPGAIGANRAMEKHVVLSMAKVLKKQLEATGRYNVVLTRNKDKYLRLHQRVSLARKQGGDLFISLHADSIGKSNVRGSSVYTLSEKSSDEQTERLAARENRADLIAGVDLSAEDEVVANILVDLAMRDTMNQSTFFANTLVDEMKSRGIHTLDNPHRFAGFAVLKAPDIPSVLIELGFMSNKNEARMLASAAYQGKLAKTLLQSIDSYFRRVRQNQRS